MSQDDPYGPSTGPLRSPTAPPYGAPGYEQAGWQQPHTAQPGYPAAGSPPPGYGYGYDTGPRRTNVMAILGLVFAFVCSPLGIVFSAIGLGQVGKRGEKGRGLALTGLILSIVFLVIGVLAVVAALRSPAVQDALDAARASASSAADPSPANGATDGDAATGGAGAGDATGVAAACRTIVPALMNLEADMQDVRTPEQYRQALATLESTLSSAAGGASDAQFRQDVAQLNADLEKAAAAVQQGQDPTSLESALDADGQTVGQACGEAGYTN